MRKEEGRTGPATAGKRARITGSSAGIGEPAAKALAAEGGGAVILRLVMPAVDGAATGAGRTRTEQENDVVRNARNRLYERFPRQGSTHPESFDLTYKEVAGSIGHRPLVNYLQTAIFCGHRDS